MVRKLILFLSVAVVALPALSAEVAGVKLDDKASIGGQELVLNGAGIRTRALFKVYIGSLYLPARANDLPGVLAKSPRRVQLNLLRDLSSDQIVGAIVDGLKDSNSAAELAAVKAQTDQFVSIMKGIGDPKEGTVITFDFVDGSTRVGVNGTSKGSVQGEAFNQALTKVWLGDKPVQGDLKNAMLGR
jgi:long-chain acyl-CoA synthetase